MPASTVGTVSLPRRSGSAQAAGMNDGTRVILEERADKLRERDSYWDRF
jgi:hypothetical protein